MIRFTKRADADVPTPPADSYTLFIDTTGALKKKDPAGVVSAAGGAADINAGRTWPAPDDTAARVTHANGDDFGGDSLAAAWTQRNIAVGHLTFPPADPAIRIRLDAQGDGIWRPIPAGNFEIVASFRSLTHIVNSAAIEPAAAAMVGIGILDAAGTGVGCSFYHNARGLFMWSITTYNYAASGPTVVLDPPTGPFWLRLKKNGTNYTARSSSDGTTWSTETAAITNAFTPTQMGIGRFFTLGGAEVQMELQRFNVYAGPGFYT